MSGGQVRESCLEHGVAALLATLNRAVLELSGRLIGQSEFAQILRDVGISDEAFEELFGSREDFEHEVLSHMIRKSALAGSLATGANTYEDGFRMLPSQAMELGPRLTFRAGRDDDSFKVLLQLAVGGMTRPDLLDRCRDCLHELDEMRQVGIAERSGQPLYRRRHRKGDAVEAEQVKGQQDAHHHLVA